MWGHHAYLILGTHTESFPALQKILEAEGIVFAGNPNLIVTTVDSLSIDDARDIFMRTRTSVPEDTRRIVIVSCTQAMGEAQNALLKATEEPGERTHFFFIVPNADMLLPTLRSRLQVLPITPDTGTVSADIKAFMHGTFEKRAEILEPIIEEKQHDRALALCNGIEEELSNNTVANAEALRALEMARTYLLRRGSSLKLILEFVALSVPHI